MSCQGKSFELFVTLGPFLGELLRNSSRFHRRVVVVEVVVIVGIAEGVSGVEVLLLLCNLFMLKAYLF